MDEVGEAGGECEGLDREEEEERRVRSAKDERVDERVGATEVGGVVREKCDERSDSEDGDAEERR